MSIEVLDEIVRAQKRGEARGIASICSAHPYVLQSAMRQAAQTGAPVLVEATCNQVNQFGGYTGMTPAAFVQFARRIAAENNLPLERLLLGGDHLGPSPWQDGPMERAMGRAADMVRAYVQAGFTKIHLDASMKLGDDNPARPLEVELSARRAAWLAKAAEESLAKVSEPSQGLRYVIGTEVPIPGGATAHEDGVSVTRVEDARRTVEATHAAFLEAGLDAAWERVLAVVVQPGVEFGDDFVLDYKSAAARDLSLFSETTSLVYEAHSTDYQTREALRSLVRDHFAILKVGPGLTFAFREAVFALAKIEDELFPPENRSNLIQTLDNAMVQHPEHWAKYYRGDQAEQAFKRRFSLSDRVRYYWPRPEVRSALEKMLHNLESVSLPLALVGQYFPRQVDEVRSRRLDLSPRALIDHHIRSVLDDYTFACNG